jgi:hypothetical protein
MKGFIYSGTVFFIALILIIAVNYLILSKNLQSELVVENMKINKVYNRYVDTVRIINDAIAESYGCNAAAVGNITKAFGNPLINSTGAYVTLVSIDCARTPPVYFKADSADGTVHKQNY